MKRIVFVFLISNFFCFELLFGSEQTIEILNKDPEETIYTIKILENLSEDEKNNCIRIVFRDFGYDKFDSVLYDNIDLLKKFHLIDEKYKNEEVLNLFQEEDKFRVVDLCLINLVDTGIIDLTKYDKYGRSLLFFLLYCNKNDVLISVLNTTKSVEEYDFLLFMPLKRSAQDTMHNLIKDEKIPEDFCNKVKRGLKNKQLSFLLQNRYKIQIPEHRKEEKDQIDWIRDCLNLDYRNLYTIVFENLELLKNFKIVEEHIFWCNDLVNRLLKDVVKSSHKLLNFTDYDLYGNCFFYGLMLKKEFEKKEEIIEFFLKYWTEEVPKEVLNMSPEHVDKEKKYSEFLTNGSLLKSIYPDLYKKYVLKEVDKTEEIKIEIHNIDEDEKKANLDDLKLEDDVVVKSNFKINIPDNLGLKEKIEFVKEEFKKCRHSDLCTIIRSNFVLLKGLNLLDEQDFDVNNSDQYFNILIDKKMLHFGYDETGESFLHYLLYQQRYFVVEHILKSLELSLCKELLDMTCYKGEKNLEVYPDNMTIGEYLKNNKPELYQIYENRFEKEKKPLLGKNDNFGLFDDWKKDSKENNNSPYCEIIPAIYIKKHEDILKKSSENNDTLLKGLKKAENNKKITIPKNLILCVIIAAAYGAYYFNLFAVLKKLLGSFSWRQAL